MQGNSKIKILSLLLLFVFFSGEETKAQNSDSLYHVSVNVGFGFTRYVTSLPQFGLDKNSLNITGRIMWRPEHLLSVGIESGYLPLYKLNANNYQSFFGETDVELSMTAIPIFLVFGMEVFDNLEIYAGVGGASLNSVADYFDNRVESSSWTNAYELAASYSYQVIDNLKLSGEFKWYNLSKVEDSALILQIAIVYSLFSY